MTTTADLRRESDTAVSDLRDLDRSAALDAVVSARRNADHQEARLLAAAVHWVDLHPVTDEQPVAVFRAATCRGPLGHGQVPADEVPLAGPGTPGIAQYAVEELAAALDLSFVAGLHLVSEAVELCFRLPRLWALVQDGRLQAWKARQVARASTGLSDEAVAFVDRHLAVTGRHNRIPPLNPVLHEARLQCDPDQAAAVEQLALENRGVWLDHRDSTAVTTMTARLDTLDALDLDGTLADLASALGRLGDHRALDQRRATALAMLAHPQRALALVHRDIAAEPRPHPVPGHRRPTGRTGPSTCTSTPPTSRTRPGPAGPWRSSAPPPWRCSRTGCNASPGSPSDRSSTSPGPTLWTPTTLRRGCASWWCSVMGTACFPGAPPTPEAATWTTSARTSRATKAGHPARRPPRTWPACADGITG